MPKVWDEDGNRPRRASHNNSGHQGLRSLPSRPHSGSPDAAIAARLRLFALQSAVDDEIRPAARLEFALYFPRIVTGLEPFEKGHRLGAAVGQIALEEIVQNTRLRPFKVTVFQA